MEDGEPYMVRLTYFPGIEIPRVEIWHRRQGSGGINVYPWTAMNIPTFDSEEEGLAQLQKSVVYTFERVNR